LRGRASEIGRGLSRPYAIAFRALRV
jgi:hypothetical protein